tara:strand:- start:1628 stop:2254 length:627 start_codon:yes stop_codon:yes gene_type:complete
MAHPTLVPIITGTPGNPPTYNVGMAETFSWIPVENDASRPLYARANYIVNLSDLSISLSASDINIGGVEIVDGDNHAVRATVVQDLGNGNSIQVLTQDLESTIDDITIGDKGGVNFVTIQPAQSALRVYPASFTLCETKTSGAPSFNTGQILISNPNNSLASVILTLTSGLSCKIPVGKQSETNHFILLNLSVSAVNNYSGCEITFFG